MKTRIIHTKIWQDDFIVDLSQVQKLIFLYYITNDNIGLTGIYETTDRQVAFDIGATKTQIQEAKSLFQEKKKILFYKNWVYIVNATKLNSYVGEKLQKAIEKERSFIPDTVLELFNTLLENKDMVSGKSDTPINHNSEIINHKDFGDIQEPFIESLPNQRETRLAEASIQAILYGELQKLEIPCLLEVSFEDCRFDCVILRGDRVIAIIETKSYSNNREPNLKTKQYAKYSRYNVPVIYLTRQENVHDVICEIQLVLEDESIKGFILKRFSKRKTIESITNEDVLDVANDYQTTEAFVRSKLDDLQNYCNSKGKTYKDYKATLRNWVKRDAITLRKEENDKSKIAYVGEPIT